MKKLLIALLMLVSAIGYANESIPQSAAKRIVLKAYLSSDHVSPATGKTIAIVISKSGGAFGNPNAGATNATEVSNGWYYIDLSAADTDTLGPLIIRGTCTTCDDIEPQPYEVTSAIPADSAGVATLLSRMGSPVGASISADIQTRLAASSYTSPPSAVTIAGAVMDEPAGSHTGLIPTNLDTKVSEAGGGSVPSAAEIAAAVRDVDNGSPAAGSLGAGVQAAGNAGDPMSVNLSSGDYTGSQAGAVIWAIKAKTDTMGGAGSVAWTWPVINSTTRLPISGVKVWITTDAAGNNVIATGTTDQYGNATFQTDAGRVYVWSSKTGYSFYNPKIKDVAAQ